MELMERLELFNGMLKSAAPLQFWLFDGNGALSTLSPPEQEQQETLLSVLGCVSLLRQEIADSARMPIFIDTGTGILFLAGFCYDDLKLRFACLYGPIFTGSSSAIQVHAQLKALHIPDELLTRIDAMLEQAAIIPPQSLYQDAIMLHYALTGERITALNIRTVSHSNASSPRQKSEQFYSEHRGVWGSEQELLRMVRNGVLDYRPALERAMRLSTGLRMKEGSSLRKIKNSLLVLLALVSRAAIEGGLSPAVSYSLNDYYADRIELCSTRASVLQLPIMILDDYVTRVHNIRAHSGTSAAILDTCDYISLNLTSALDVRTLAKRVGYAEYYFSAKFKKEIGKSITDYVNEKRMQSAAEMLTDSDCSISDIQNLFGFSSRSRFYELFKAYSGLTPAQYRAGKNHREKDE